VAGARSIPLHELEAQACPACVKNKATPLVLVCASGMRSGRAVAIARKLGYEQADSLAGGSRAGARPTFPSRNDAPSWLHWRAMLRNLSKGALASPAPRLSIHGWLVARGAVSN
jgi:hypothetical protein